jgi:hypothetical protein
MAIDKNAKLMEVNRNEPLRLAHPPLNRRSKQAKKPVQIIVSITKQPVIEAKQILSK